jgi:hypothetical protein
VTGNDVGNSAQGPRRPAPTLKSGFSGLTGVASGRLMQTRGNGIVAYLSSPLQCGVASSSRQYFLWLLALEVWRSLRLVPAAPPSWACLGSLLFSSSRWRGLSSRGTLYYLSGCGSTPRIFAFDSSVHSLAFPPSSRVGGVTYFFFFFSFFPVLGTLSHFFSPRPFSELPPSPFSRWRRLSFLGEGKTVRPITEGIFLRRPIPAENATFRKGIAGLIFRRGHRGVLLTPGCVFRTECSFSGGGTPLHSRPT